MYLPEDVNLQLSLAETPGELGAEQFPNVTKGISDVLEMCEAAGLDSKGFGCGMSIAFALLLAAALLCAVVVVVIPAIAGLITAIITVIGSVIVAIVAGISATVLGLFAAVAAVFTAVFRMVVKIVSLPFRVCIGREPPSPLDSPGVGGVVSGQIRYTRDTGGRPPSYQSDEGVDPLERRK